MVTQLKTFFRRRRRKKEYKEKFFCLNLCDAVLFHVFKNGSWCVKNFIFCRNWSKNVNFNHRGVEPRFAKSVAANVTRKNPTWAASTWRLITPSDRTEQAAVGSQLCVRGHDVEPDHHATVLGDKLVARFSPKDPFDTNGSSTRSGDVCWGCPVTCHWTAIDQLALILSH